jgi:hypothetical protein
VLFEPEFRYQDKENEPAYWLLFQGDQILAWEENGQFVIPE